MSDERESHWEAVEEAVDLLETGEVDAAIDELGRLAAEDPENEYAFHFLGNALYEKKEYEKALAAYVRALEVVPRYAGAMIGAGQALRMLGQHERAMRMGKEVLRMRKDDPDALYLLGLIAFQRGEYKLAHGLLARFLETSPEVEVRLEVEGIMQICRGEALPLEPEQGPLDG
jgi:cytochrome c-type biogenesis protein CcmH/NrfG